MRNSSVSNHFNSNSGHNVNSSNINMNSGTINGAGNGMIARAFPLRILVHGDVVGAIIGRSGSTIKTITQQTRARIDVHREESPEHQEKVITINGAPENCSEACFKIIEVVQNEMNAKFDATNDPERDITLKILASSNLIGRLIGKSGATIKKIMEQTSTRINISTNGITESTGEHTIVVVGKLEYIRQAERLISSKLRAAYMSDMNTSLHTMSQQPYLFNNVLLPYMPSPYSQNSILASIANPQANHSGNSMTRAMPLSTPHQGQIPSSMYNTGAPSYLPLYPTANVPPTGPGLMGFNPVAPGFEQEKETTYIYIPSIMVGAIIGKSGTAIKEMISTSGASIKVATASALSDTQRSEKSQEDDVKVPETETVEINAEDQHLNGENPEKSTTYVTPSPRVSRYQSGINDPQSTRKVTIVGYPTSQYSAQYMIYRKISMESGKGDISLMVEIYVPSQLVGRIIGKGGSTVKLLQKQTRTTIRLPEDKPSQTQTSPTNNGETCVQITGEFEGSQAAQRHIKNMIREGLYARPSKSQHHKNNESNTVKNNAQNNIQSSDNGNVSTHFATEDKSVGTLNEKNTDKSVLIRGNNRFPRQRESPSLSCNSDDQTTKQEEKSHNSSQQIISTGTDDERNRGEQDVISNNNTIINNLNSSKQSVKDMKLRDYTTDGLKKSDGDSNESHIENGKSVHLHNTAT